MIERMVVAGAIAVAGLGVGAAGAAAYSISGGAYVASATSIQSATIGGAYTVTCTGVTFSGAATGSATTSFTPSFPNCSVISLPAFHTASGPWQLTVTGGPTAGWYTARVEIPVGSTVGVSFPLGGCTVVNDGPQAFSHGVGGNVIRLRNLPGGGVEAEASVNGLAFTATGCPFVGGASGTYTTGGTVSFPGITIS